MTVIYLLCAALALAFIGVGWLAYDYRKLQTVCHEQTLALSAQSALLKDRLLANDLLTSECDRHRTLISNLTNALAKADGALTDLLAKHIAAVREFAHWRHNTYAKGLLRYVPSAAASVYDDANRLETVHSMRVPECRISHMIPDYAFQEGKLDTDLEFEVRRVQTRALGDMIAKEMLEQLYRPVAN